MNYGCTNSTVCSGTDEFGCATPITWADVGASWIWAPGLTPGSTTASDASYYFEYSFNFEGDINSNYNAVITFALDDGMKVWIDGAVNEVDIGTPGRECKLQTASIETEFKDQVSHQIKVWGVNGHCDNPTCPYTQNPAGFGIRVAITPK
jgi:hypothetical protein